MLGRFFATFAVVFLAELPDKTMVATLVLTTTYRRAFWVWLGAAAAFLVHVTVAVVAGDLLGRLPERPVKLAVAALFAVGRGRPVAPTAARAPRRRTSTSTPSAPPSGSPASPSRRCSSPRSATSPS